MGGIGAAPASVGRAIVNVFDARRLPYQDSSPVLVTVRDGNQRTVSREAHRSASVEFIGLRVFGNSGDNYTFIASAAGYNDAGFFPVRMSAEAAQVVDLMLLPKSPRFDFAPARWETLQARRQSLARLLAAGAGDAQAAERRYNDLKDHEAGEVLACLLNTTTALEQILLPQKTALEYLQAIRWDLDGPWRLARDRFFAWADPALIPQLELARLQNKFADAPGTLHPGATRSFKQVEFGEANVQLTIHGNDRQQTDGCNCVLVEADIDYFRDPAAHLLLEVMVNAFGSLTDPRTVYALRWIAGRRAGVPEFDPLYVIAKE